jgi:hypothetical protein
MTIRRLPRFHRFSKERLIQDRRSHLKVLCYLCNLRNLRIQISAFLASLNDKPSVVFVSPPLPDARASAHE